MRETASLISVQESFNPVRKVTAFVGDLKVFAGWAVVGFHPVVFEETGILEPGEQGIEGAFHHDQLGDAGGGR